MNHLSLFSGIGGATEAIRQAGLDCKTIAFSEINQSTIKMYRALHGHDAEDLGDISSVGFDTLYGMKGDHAEAS